MPEQRVKVVNIAELRVIKLLMPAIQFLPRDALLSTVYAVVVCLSVCVCVCVSVTLRYCIKMAKRRIT